MTEDGPTTILILANRIIPTLNTGLFDLDFQSPLSYCHDPHTRKKKIKGQSGGSKVRLYERRQTADEQTDGHDRMRHPFAYTHTYILYIRKS